MRILGRFMLAAGAGILVLLFGVFAATLLSGFVWLERNASPHGGFLVLEFVAISVFVSFPMSIGTACWVLFRVGSHPSLAPPQNRGELQF